MRHVPLEVPLPRFSLGGLLQGHHAGATRVEPLGEPLDGAALARGVPALADHHHALAGVLDPALEFEQFDLEDALRPLVLAAAHLLVVRVVLPPCPHGAAGLVEQEGLLRIPVVDGQPVEEGVRPGVLALVTHAAWGRPPR